MIFEQTVDTKCPFTPTYATSTHVIVPLRCFKRNSEKPTSRFSREKANIVRWLTAWSNTTDRIWDSQNFVSFGETEQTSHESYLVNYILRNAIITIVYVLSYELRKGLLLEGNYPLWQMLPLWRPEARKCYMSCGLIYTSYALREQSLDATSSWKDDFSPPGRRSRLSRTQTNHKLIPKKCFLGTAQRARQNCKSRSLLTVKAVMSDDVCVLIKITVSYKIVDLNDIFQP